jgi:hypothetical protein
MKGAGVKKKEMENIALRKRDTENHKMLLRIVSVKHEYSSLQWEEDERVRQRKLKDMAGCAPEVTPVQHNISGEGWQRAASQSRPATANIRREQAWDSNTTRLQLVDSNELLSFKPTPLHVEHQQRSQARVWKPPIRPKTADSTRQRGDAGQISRRGCHRERLREREWEREKERMRTYGSASADRLGRSRPGYSGDPADRDFDAEFRDLFAHAREECRRVSSATPKRRVDNFMEKQVSEQT